MRDLDKLRNWLSPAIVTLIVAPFAAIGFLLKLFSDAFDCGEGLVEADFYMQLIGVVLFGAASVAFALLLLAVVSEFFRATGSEDSSWPCRIFKFVLSAFFLGMLVMSLWMMSTTSNDAAQLVRPILDNAKCEF